MNKAQSKSKLTKVLSLILALVMVLSLMPLMGAASQTAGDNTASDSSDFMRIFHLDCGRKYFTVAQIEELIDTAAANNYTHVELAFGNDGLRFLLDNMSLTVNGTTYESGKVSTAINNGNKEYNSSASYSSQNNLTNELTETEMDAIISYANGKGIGIIPLLNSPGHMDAIIDCMESLGMSNVAYSSSATTIDLTNDDAVAFTQALVKKYAVYFAGKGCEYFNIGADEYANDVNNGGFSSLIKKGTYGKFVSYVNSLVGIVDKAGIENPMAFNDGIYYNSNTSYGTFDTKLIVCYWTSGWNEYTPASASFLADKGHKIINTNDAWYYVLGNANSSYTYSHATSGVSGTSCTSITGDGANTVPTGCMLAFWCDSPSKSYTSDEVNNVETLIRSFSSNNSTYFTEVVPPSTVYNTNGNNTADDADTIKVTAKGLDGLTVSDASVTITNAETDKIAAYDITPNIDGTKYESSATVSIKIPEGWDSSKVRAFVQETGGTITTITGTAGDDGFYTFTAPHFSVMGLYQLAATAYTTEEEITLTVGGTATAFQEGVNTEGTEDTSGSGYVANVATAEAKYADASSKIERTRSNTPTTFSKKDTSVSVKNVLLSDGTNYMVVNSDGSIGNTKDINEATPFDVTYKNGKVTIYCSEINQYLNITSNYTLEMGSSSNLNYSTSSNYFYYGSDSSSGSGYNRHKIAFVGGSWQVTTRTYTSEYARLYTCNEQPVSTKAGTTVTFTGISEGHTEIQVGSVLYKITVEDKAPTDAMTSTSIKLEYWITNFYVYTSKTDTTQTQTFSTSSDGATNPEGIEIAAKAPNPAYSNFDGDVTVYYWQAMRLDSDNQQTTAADDDETTDGTTLTHIRYHNSAWQYKTTDGVWHYFLSTDQLVAYYLQGTEVTQEIKTYMKDWGYDTKSSTITSDGSLGSVALTVAVVYPDGTVSPTESEMYANSTTIFNYKSDRDIGIVAPTNNSDYNISKITVTSGARTRSSVSSGTDNWYGTSATTPDTITWEKKTKADGSQWYDETVVWDKVTNAGTTPMVNGKTSKITWSAKNTAKLVLIYLEPIEKATNLNIVWYDDNTKTRIISTQIAMTYNQGDTEPTFTTALMNASGNCIGGTSSWSSNVKGNENYLPDDAYVTNSSGVPQTISKSLSNISGINGIYTSGLYEYVSADISSDGKTLTLHYNLKASTDKVYVVDFGLPVEIPASAFGIEDISTVKSVSFDEKEVVTEKAGIYGTGKINTANGTLTYTLTKPLDARIPIPVYIKFNNGSATATVRSVFIIPATSVYYEDSFATFTDGSAAEWETVNDGVAQTSTTQALEALGSKTNVYGTDSAYSNSTKYSMGSAHKVTVTSAMAATTGVTWPTATFTFTGTGFDIISLTDNNSGAISVDVYSVASDGTETFLKDKIVNNYYGYTYENGEWTATPKKDNNALYQIPVVTITDLNYGKYKVVITPIYATYTDQTGDGEYSFWLDAIRVYNPMGKDVATYAQDGEGYPQYIKLRDELACDEGIANSNMVFIDGGNTADVATYANYGPNNEVYLAKGQAITFSVASSENIASIQIGAKAPNGTGKTANLVVNSTPVQTLSTATEMYYDITSYAKDGNQVTISNKGDGILSLTNLKITYKEGPSATTASDSDTSPAMLTALSDEEVNTAVMSVRALFAAPVVETFKPETFKASWNSVRKGQTATLTVKTSEDVESIMVDGVAVTEYTTRTERNGFGWWAEKVTYRVFTYTVTAEESGDHEIIAFNEAGAQSEPITTMLTVKESGSSWWSNLWNNFFGRWF